MAQISNFDLGGMMLGLSSLFRVAVVGIGVLAFAACDSAYYGALEKVGIEKRDILVDRVEDAVEAQEDAKDEFKTAFERFSSVVTVEASKLQDTYEDLSESYEDAESKAAEVSERIDGVEDVSGDLFDEWNNELGEISNAKLRASSARQLKDSQTQYKELIRSMRQAESRMAPVLSAFKDNVLFLKHNLNAQAISSLKGELTSIETDVANLIRDMENSIARSQAFIRDMESTGT